LANGFTEWLNASAQGQPILSAVDGQLLFYLVFGLLAAIVSWINKRKQAAKRDRLAQSVPVQRSKPAQAGEPTGWLARLEKLAETQLDNFNQKLESPQPDNSEQEYGETPTILPPVIGATSAETCPKCQGEIRLWGDDLQCLSCGYKPQVSVRPTRQARQTEETPKPVVAVPKVQPAVSPVYSSPIYTGNIARRIASDIKIARQAVVASIILGPPRSLESPEQITRY
jgi:hypothetical protein